MSQQARRVVHTQFPKIRPTSVWRQPTYVKETILPGEAWWRWRVIPEDELMRVFYPRYCVYIQRKSMAETLVDRH
jgi:hypothetical protein